MMKTPKTMFCTAFLLLFSLWVDQFTICGTDPPFLVQCVTAC